MINLHPSVYTAPSSVNLLLLLAKKLVKNEFGELEHPVVKFRQMSPITTERSGRTFVRCYNNHGTITQSL